MLDMKEVCTSADAGRLLLLLLLCSCVTPPPETEVCMRAQFNLSSISRAGQWVSKQQRAIIDNQRSIREHGDPPEEAVPPSPQPAAERQLFPPKEGEEDLHRRKHR